jgi:hypothetical protein
MAMEEKVLLRKRVVIESVNDFLKNICQIEHTRHRSLANYQVNLFGDSMLIGFYLRLSDFSVELTLLYN